MDYETLRRRCHRIMNLHPDSDESPLGCMRLLTHLDFGSSRAIAAEMLARELAEYVEEHR